MMGPSIESLTDADIVAMDSGNLDAQWALLPRWDRTAVEEPPGESQIDHHEDRDKWLPRGDVLRCILDDGRPGGNQY